MSRSLSSVPAPVREALPVARDWFMAHHEELASRTTACFAYHRPEEREEAVAEALAIVYVAVVRAAQRGTLSRLTVYWLVVFAARQVRSGRRCTGSSSRCVHSAQTRRLGRAHVQSLEALRAVPASARDAFAWVDRDAEDPAEVVRRRMDYPVILAGVSARARSVFQFLIASHGSGRLADLAEQLGVSAGRVSQLKTELAQALAAHGYEKPLGRRPVPRTQPGS